MFINFLREIPGRKSIPLSYIWRPRGVVLRDNYEDLLYEYIDRVPLNGISFTTDTAEVHKYLVNFISDKDIAESKI